MTYGIVAFHYPRNEHRDELVQRVRRAAEVMETVPGCIEALCWEDETSGAVVATGKWESEEARITSFRAVSEARIDFDYDERESRPREVFTLRACESRSNKPSP